MSLIEHNQIPAGRCEQFVESRWPLQRVNARYQTIMFREGIRLSVGDIALASEHLKVQMKCLVKLALPVVYQTCWYDHQRPGKLAARGQLTKDESGFDGLTQPNAIGDQVAA